MRLRVLLIIAAALLLFFGLNVYVGWNGAVWWQTVFPGISAGWFWALYFVLAFSYISSMVFRKLLPYRLFTLFKVIGSYGLALQFYALLLAPLAELAVWALRWQGAPREEAIRTVGTVVWVIIGLLLAVGSRNAWRTVVRRYDLKVNKRAGDGRQELRIAAASDLHLGTMVGNKHLGRLVDWMDQLEPDLILLPGDVLDDSIEPFIRENMAAVMQRLKAPLGVYACLGNHEYIGGHVGDYTERMKAIGIEVLTDHTILVAESFYVAGRKDKMAERFTREGRLPLRELLEQVDRSLPLILLDHQPYALEAAAAEGVDLLVSGHTHRGQMAPNHWITRKLFEVDWGYLRKGAMHAIVSSGFGFWGPPIRIGSRSEILDIRITFED